MIYAFDLNVYRNNLLRAAEGAIALMRNHPQELPSWLWYRLENLNADIRDLDTVLKKYCAEVVS